MTAKKRPWSPPQIIWSSLITMVVWTAIGFSWFGTGFNWTTHGIATDMSRTAVQDSLAKICVAQARSSPNAEAALAELSGLSAWKLGELGGYSRGRVKQNPDRPGVRVQAQGDLSSG